ncbi:hypothetical protein [Aurantibacillus circumpalustris]|uniref:hypothetical protein n=1 Tax=Aurantibacillus circumpalustris TaxID=3036359 RepID=UPI00295B23FB|nr:hypothetical protein [Aurantibacillus circumpalustris]
MKVHCIIFVFLISSIKNFSQEPQFDIKFSEPLAVFIYVQQLSETHPDNPFKKDFSASLYNRDKYKRLLAQFDTLRIDYVYEFEGFPYGSKMPGFTIALLKKCLMNSANLKVFKTAAVGIIPNSTLHHLTTILYEFQFIYRELVYQPNKVKFEKQLHEIVTFAKTKKLDSYFNKGLTFYRSYWDDSFPFEIAFYPYPSSSGFTAEAFCNNAISALSTDTKDYTTVLSVMLHEIFHILYDEQPVIIKKNISKWFANNRSKYSAYAYLLFNEALATSLGNGYVYESLSGKRDEGDWYDRKYINQMAKKIYPMLVDYINQKKGIDEGFINIYIKFYEENFSEWLEEMDNLMCYRYVISDNASDFGIFSKQYPYCSISQSEDEVSEVSINRMKEKPITKVIIVSKENQDKLTIIKKNFVELKDWKFKAKQDFFFSVFLEDKTQLIVVNAVKKTSEELISGRVTLPPPNIDKK